MKSQASSGAHKALNGRYLGPKEKLTGLALRNLHEVAIMGVYNKVINMVSSITIVSYFKLLNSKPANGKTS